MFRTDAQLCPVTQPVVPLHNHPSRYATGVTVKSVRAIIGPGGPNPLALLARRTESASGFCPTRTKSASGFRPQLRIWSAFFLSFPTAVSC